MAELLSSPLESIHIGLGATMTAFAGWNMPLRYGSDRQEHAAVRTEAGKFDLSHMGQIEVEGPQAAEILDYSLCTKPSTMPVGRARYSMMLAPDGGILDDLIVYRLADDGYLIVANGANRLVVRDELTARARAWCATRGLAEEHSIVDHTSSRCLVAVQGPRSLERLTPLLDRDANAVAELGYYRARRVRIGDVPAVVARTGYTGEIGYEIMAPASAAAQIWQAIDALPCGLASRDTLRLEAGMPLYGQELDRTVAPGDVGAARLVGPHEFVGSTAVASRERVWDLYGLVGQGRRAARAGNPVLAGGELVGTVTSGVLSPTLGYPVALARLEPGLAEGACLNVDVRGTLQPMRIVRLPFYTRSS